MMALLAAARLPDLRKTFRAVSNADAAMISASASNVAVLRNRWIGIAALAGAWVVLSLATKNDMRNKSRWTDFCAICELAINMSFYVLNFKTHV